LHLAGVEEVDVDIMAMWVKKKMEAKGFMRLASM
jgi:hypothetical protein